MDLLALDSRRGAKTSACVPAPSARTGQHARVNVCVRARALRPWPAADPDGALCSHTNRSPRAGLPRSTIFSASNCLICIRSRFITVLPGNRTVSLAPSFSLPFPILSSSLAFLIYPIFPILAAFHSLNAFSSQGGRVRRSSYRARVRRREKLEIWRGEGWHEEAIRDISMIGEGEGKEGTVLKVKVLCGLTRYE